MTNKMARNVNRMNDWKLKELLQETDKDFIFRLQIDEYNLTKLASNIKHFDENFPLLVQIVARLCSPSLIRVFEHNVIGLMEKLTATQFLNGLNFYLLTKVEKSPENCRSLFSNTAPILKQYSEIFPHLFMKVFRPFITTTSNVIQKNLNNGNYEDELKTLTSITVTDETMTEVVDGMCRTDYLNALSPKNNFRHISPTICYADVHDNIKPLLCRNIIEGKYDSVEHYLDVQFRLLREDFVEPMRQAILDFRKQVATNNNLQLNGANIYHYTCFRNTCISIQYGIKQELHFDRSSLPYVNWKNTKRLLCGSLVCLSSDNFDHFTVAVVCYSNPNQLANGIVFVKLLNTNYDDMSKPCVMIESPSYYEANAPVLRGLKTINETNLPFKKYIVDITTTIEPPNYLLKTSGTQHLQNISIENLDESQNRALKCALNQEIAIIQGPPATGKTYVGLKLVQMMMDNECGPILVVCFTNHALDQFLEGILQFCPKGLIRVGGQSTSTSLIPFNLRQIWVSGDTKKEIDKFQFEVITSVRQASKKMKKYRRFLQRNFDNNIIPEWLLVDLDVISKDHYVQLEEAMFQDDPEQCNSLEIWLNAKDYHCANYTLYCKQNFNKATAYLFHPDLIAKKEVDDVLANEEKSKRIHYEEAEQIDLLETYKTIQFQPREKNMEEKNTFKAQLQQLVKEVTEQLKRKDYMPEHDLKNVDDIWALSSKNRWRLYRAWIMIAKNKCKKQLNYLDAYCDKQWNMFTEFKQECMLHRFKDAKIIGMTTSGAAIHRRTLQRLQLPILIVEEAAEVLESHVISSLTSTCQHIVLIGDQQQLRPKPNVYELAKDFKLDVSLFERLVKNDFPYEQLKRQHRMRPEISSLLVPNIYPNLLDHPNVKDYGNVAGMKTNVLFFDHNNDESNVSDSRSKSNHFEAELLIGLCGYLIKQGYDPSQITVLTGYLGQVALFSGHLPKGVRLASIDGYQGEENDIVLLSLVRSNSKGAVGFLKVENRVCVALSRAKMGLYCVGNLSLLSSQTDVWKPIVQKLTDANLIGKSFSLVCQNHPETVTEIFSVNDFRKVSYGGCSVPCSAILQCGHNCPHLCHILDSQHKNIECDKVCFRSICNLGHKCHKRCGVACGVCEAPVLKQFPCGHENVVPCNVESTSLNCFTRGIYQLDCGHTATITCASVKEYRCTVLVERLLPCDHKQKVPCSTNPLKYSCKQTCVRRLKCGHEISASCGQSTDMTVCLQKCERELTCGHKCQQVCYEVCERKPCNVKVEVESPCGHSVTISCHTKKEAEFHCKHPCATKRSCGHVCKGTCSTCLLGRIHINCDEKCSRILLSGEPCPNICSRVCSTKWTIRKFNCRHIIKSDSCGLCCMWKCAHKECSRKCHEVCNRDACDESCPNRLLCQHACVGYCGEPCPKFCRLCSHRDYIQRNVLGFNENSLSKFILLSDCDHVIEKSILDRQMKSNDDVAVISPQRCPLCNTVITSNFRYGNAIRTCRDDIAAVRREIYSFTANCKIKTRSILTSIEDQCSTININLPHFINGLNNLIESENFNTFDIIFLRNVAQLTTKLSEIYKKLQAKRITIEGSFKNKSGSIENVLSQLKTLEPVLTSAVKQRSISEAFWGDLQRELLRIEYLEKMITTSNTNPKSDLDDIHSRIMVILNTKNAPFSVEREQQLKMLFTERIVCAEANNTVVEPLNYLTVPAFIKGRWFKCKTNGHIFASELHRTPISCPKCH